VARPLVGQTSCNFGTSGSCNLSLGISLTPTDVLRLTLSATSTNLGTPVESDYTAGFRAATGPSVTVKANRSYHVAIKANTATFGYTPVGGLSNPNKPAGDLQWGLTAAGTFTALATSDITAINGTATAGSVQSMFYRTSLAYATDKPGTYTLTVLFTLSAP
jgi:hypothetical protein